MQKEMKLLTNIWKDHTANCPNLGQKIKKKHKHKHGHKKHRKSRALQPEVGPAPIAVA